ncbi:ATP-binding protein [Pareuzebyella sediminis]|uniref:ATP-binding protein n=1 Tax=Pareuzebyella sediminis TaxID=2607998 RepID=UPI0011EDD4DE|nr:ATP-binding protein [Pareuzebyella sediminis]
MKKYPFKFLDSYHREDKGIFFGRDEEIDALYNMLFQSSVVFVYGASGTGKTSLINCGLACRFEPHDWLPLMVRRGSDINNSLEHVLNSAGGPFDTDIEKKDLDKDADGLGSSTGGKPNPFEKIIRSVYEKTFRPIYLIFDQFEELFILGNLHEQNRFIETVKAILASEQPVKLLFSIREEYLGHLYEFEKKVPQLLQKKLRIEPMNLEKVKQVIIGVSEYEDSNVRVKEGEAEQVAEGIFEKIKGKGKSLSIQLPFLQVFLDKYYLNLTKDRSRKEEAIFSVRSLKEMGEIGDILVDFLEEQVIDVARELKDTYPEISPQLTWKILSPFSTLDGTKEPMGISELCERLPDIEDALIQDIVNAMVNRRMLRYNEATETFELSHDTLAKPIAERRSAEETSLLEVRRLIQNQVAVNENAREYFTEKQLLFVEPYLDRLKPSEEEEDWMTKSAQFVQEQKDLAARRKLDEFIKKRKARQRWLQRIGLVVIAALILSIFLAIKYRNQEIKAEQAKVRFEKAKNYANELLQLVMKDRGRKYETENDSALRETLHVERTAPIENLVTPMAAVTNFSINDDQYRNFVLWIDVPSFRKNEIEEVQYIFCKGFVNPVRISKEPATSFAIGYLGWGYCPTMNIDIILKKGDTLHRNYSFTEYFKNNP